MRKLKIAVIGVGHLGGFHAQKLCEIESADLKFLVDLSPERLQKVSQGLKERYQREPALYTDFQRVLPEVDAVVLSTPTSTHYEIAKEVLLQGKALFLEKPIADTLPKARELVEMAEQKGIPLQIGYIERFQKAVRLLCERVKNPLFIEAHRLSSFAERNLDIDVVLDLMIHDLDLVFLLKKGVEVDFIHAVGAPLFTNKADIVNARIVFKDQSTCNLTASRISLSKQRKFRVFEKGIYHSVDTLEKSYLEIRPSLETRNFSLDKKNFPEDDPLKEELISFVRGVLEGRELIPSGREALLPLEVAFKIKEEVEKRLQSL
jgi:predicted dehydrogenase